jgi:DNA-binding NarL/FixJ family response regulator
VQADERVNLVNSAPEDRARPTVVLVEDDEEVRDVLRLLFDLDARFEVVAEAADGLAGIEAVARHGPSVVILDMELPGATGPEVIVAAYPDPFTLLDVLRLGADCYLDKATAWTDLIPTVAELCGLPSTGHPADA